MYTENDRCQLLAQIIEFIKTNYEFECLVQIGSGALGFTDIYSDIDLMAGCIDASSVEAANSKLTAFFKNNGAEYIDPRKWSTSALGLSAYWKNGLSVDISFMPTSDMPIRSKCWKLLWSMDGELEAGLTEKTKLLKTDESLVNDQYHHRFFYALRKAEISILRNNLIYADIVLGEARQLLLAVEVMTEGEKLHQFKAYHRLSEDFLFSLQGTYPKGLSKMELISAKESLLSLYVNTIRKNNLCEIDDSHFTIVNCFD